MKICVHGTEHVSVAGILSKAGCNVSLIADDDHDAARLSEFCAINGVILTRDICADVHLGHSGVSLDWRNAQTALRITWGASGGLLVEVQGDTNAGRNFARVLECPVMFAVQVPLTARFAAVLSSCCEGLMLRGASPLEIDTAATGIGFALGPLAMQDRDGVDAALLDRSAVFDTLGYNHTMPLFARAVSEGRLGRAAGVGWYRYPGGVGPVEDPLVEDLAAEEAHFFGVIQDMPSHQTCVAALSHALRGVQTAPDVNVEDADFVMRHLFGPDIHLS